jgi:hypothetical protein
MTVGGWRWPGQQPDSANGYESCGEVGDDLGAAHTQPYPAASKVVGSIILSINGTQRGNLRGPASHPASMRAVSRVPRHRGKTARRQTEVTEAGAKSRSVHGSTNR